MVQSNNIALSIVVPAYNVQNTLTRLVESVLKSKHQNNLEVIVVNDGSSDSTLVLAQKLQEKHPKLIHVISTENGGHGYALSNGIRVAKGKYCRPVDGDDWLDSEGLDYFVEQIRSGVNADLLLSSFYKYNLANHKQELIRYNLPKTAFSINMLNEKNIYIGYHSASYRTDILRRIPDFNKHCFYVDNEYIAYPIPMVHKILYLDTPLYVHSIGEGNQSTAMDNLIKNVENVQTVAKAILKYMQKANCSNAQKEYMYRVTAKLLSLYGVICIYMGVKGKIRFNSICRDLNMSYPEFLSAQHGSTKSFFNLYRRLNFRFYDGLVFVKRLQMKNRGIVW